MERCCQAERDACQALAVALYGSEEAMVEAMNAKANELGMTHSHFTNTVGRYLRVVGMHDEQHYTTAQDLAVLMKAAWNNEDIRTAMSTKKYATSSSYYHGDGISLKNTWALEQQAAGIEDGHILGEKQVIRQRQVTASSVSVKSMNCQSL